MTKVIYLFVLTMFVSVAYGQNSPDPRITPTVKAVSRALPSVVNIGTERIVSVVHSRWGNHDPFERLSRNFYEGQSGRKETSLGSGAVISAKGLIVTNSHVVHRATKIIITTSDGKQYLAKEIAGDSLNDVALLQLTNLAENESLKPIKYAKPDSLLLGEPVIAVGNPYGLGSSISRGVLSAVGRKISFQGKILFADILQTDAAINPGNSGGPLININGSMIGINTAIYGEADGIGFAIPMKRVESILATWMIPEKFRDVSLGIIPGEKLINNKVVFFIREVLPASPAWQAGLREGNIITAVNNSAIKNLMDISNKLWDLKSEENVSFNIVNKGKVTLKVEKLKALDGKTLALNRLGIGLQKLTLKLATAMNYPFHGGLLVNDITNGTENIKRGEILVRIGNIPVYEFSDIRRALKNKHYGDSVNTVFIAVTKENGRIFISKRNTVLNVK